MSKRVAIIGIYHESNTFLNSKTSFENFVQGHLLFGEEIRDEYLQAFHEVGGMFEVLEAASIEAIPLMFAEATPSGIITSEALDELYQKMVELFNEKAPYDGVLVVAHGAAVSESYPDADGWWLQQIRSLVGSEKPVIGTLDPHANVSRLMIDVTDALVAYKTNPHTDQREAGRQAARLMLQSLSGSIKPVQHFNQPATTISIEKQYTKTSPCKELYELANQMNRKSNVLSVSVLLGFPYSDVKEMGSGFLIVTDNDLELAQSTSRKLGNYLWERKHEFVGEKISVEEAILKQDKLSKPVLMLDMGDNIGGGAPGDSTFLLEALDQARKWKSFVCIFDPGSVQLADRCEKGSIIQLEIGGKTDNLHGRPYSAEVTVQNVTQGIYEENEPRHGGQVHFNMGKIAIVETFNTTTIMLTSLRSVPFSLNQLTSFGINPACYDVLVAKGVHAPIAAYESVCENFIHVNTNGVTCADLTKLTYVNRRKPLYPFEV